MFSCCHMTVRVLGGCDRCAAPGLVDTALSAPLHRRLSQLVQLTPQLNLMDPSWGRRCLSTNIPSLMADLCVPTQSFRLSCGEANQTQTHEVGSVCVCGGGLNNVTPIRADLNVKGAGLRSGTSGRKVASIPSERKRTEMTQYCNWTL